MIPHFFALMVPTSTTIGAFLLQEGQTSTPTLSCDGAEVDSLNGTGASFLDDVTGYVEDASVCSEEADFSLRWFPGQADD
jgi:hypothetical protein